MKSRRLCENLLENWQNVTEITFASLIYIYKLDIVTITCSACVFCMLTCAAYRTQFIPIRGMEQRSSLLEVE